VIHYVLAAPGTGKSAVTRHLRALLPGWAVLDWDAFMDPAETLAGVDIRQAPQTWSGYERLVRTIVDQIRVNTVILGVSTPHQLRDWPHGDWLLLDCADDNRRIRLAPRRNPAETEQAITDAASYRSLGLPVLDTTDLEPREVATAIARVIHDTGRSAQHDFDVTGYEKRIRTGECFICALVAGKPGHYREHILYRDDRLIAFLSQPPIQLGYCLVAPLDHRTEVVTDFELDEYLALQAFLHRLGLVLSQVLSVERLYLMSLGSKAGNAHVHWHVVPLPPGVPFDEQQFHAVMVDRAGYLNVSQDQQARLANRISDALHGRPGKAK
jgi:diadenosine tetraphosphate (Ap4A) HIT family hydrolase